MFTKLKDILDRYPNGRNMTDVRQFRIGAELSSWLAELMVEMIAFVHAYQEYKRLKTLSVAEYATERHKHNLHVQALDKAYAEFVKSAVALAEKLGIDPYKKE